MIGVDFLSAYAVTLDLDKHRIRFQPSGSPRPSGDVVPVELRDRGRGLSTKLFIGKRLLSPVMIDTGDDASMAITKDAWHASDVPLRLTDIASTGLSGDAPVVRSRRSAPSGALSSSGCACMIRRRCRRKCSAC